MTTPKWIKKPTAYLKGYAAGLQEKYDALEAEHNTAVAKAALEAADRLKELESIETEIEDLQWELNARNHPDPADVAALEELQGANAGDTGWHNDNAPEG